MNLLQTINRFYYNITLNELRAMNDNQLYPKISYNSLLYLDVIAYMEPCTVSSLAEALRVSKPAVTSKVNELIRQGLVEKIPSKTDKRSSFIRVKPEIIEEQKAYDVVLKNSADIIEERYSREDIEKFCEFLDIMDQVASEEYRRSIEP